MGRIIKQFSDGTYLEYDNGTFDEWCVYFIDARRRVAPKDIDYFIRLRKMARRYGSKKIYTDFVKIYDAVGPLPEMAVLEKITALAAGYGDDSLVMDKLFTILYAGMIAEENKEKAVLKKRVKRLGMHQVLCEGMAPEVAANFSKGKKAREIAVACRKRGF